jgi:hypothetical protein
VEASTGGPEQEASKAVSGSSIGGQDSSISSDLPAEEQAPASARTRRAGQRQPQGARLWCHLFLNKRHPDFDLVPMLIGRSGCNMREIYQATNAKIRVRGRGSGHLEVDGSKEAPVPLMVAVTSEGGYQVHFRTAVEMTISKLKEVQQLFVQFCQQRNLSESLTRERNTC